MSSDDGRASDGSGDRRGGDASGASSASDTHQTTLTGERAETDELVLSAHVANNAEVFPKVLALHVPDGSAIADVTCGTLAFWKQVKADRYDLSATDIDPEKSRDSVEGVDCRDLPYSPRSMDAVVLDPPYASGYFRRDPETRPGVGSHASFREAYSSGSAHDGSGKHHRAVVDLYRAAGAEAARVLREGGTFIVKVQDEVSANTQELTHIQITRLYEELGFETVDLFVVVRPNRPSVSGIDRQVHARKNHSYFMVYRRKSDDDAGADA